MELSKAIETTRARIDRAGDDALLWMRTALHNFKRVRHPDGRLIDLNGWTFVFQANDELNQMGLSPRRSGEPRPLFS